MKRRGPAILSLEAHLGTGDPLAWRAALRVLEHAIGRPAETPDEPAPIADPMGVARITQRQRSALPDYARMIDGNA